MFQFLQKVDLFGAEEKLQIDGQNPIYKSRLGGIMTIILYGISFAYFLNELIDWIQNNKLPKITTLRSQIDKGETVDLTGRFLEIEYYQEASFNTDPFNPSNMILVPQVRLYLGSQGNKQILEMKFENKQQKNGIVKNVFYLDNEQIIGSPNYDNASPETIYYTIVLVQCEAQPLQFKCASKAIIDSYLDEQNYSIKITFFTTEFDTKTKQLYKVPKTNVKRISSQVKPIYLFNLQANNLKLDDGILFSNTKQFSYISNYEVEQQGFLIENEAGHYSEKILIKDIILMIELRLDNIKTLTLIEYSKISEILADTGAIISWILQIALLIQKYNEKLSQDKTINEVIKMYFPDFLNLTIKRKLNGQIIGAQIKDKHYDPQKIDRLINRITGIARSKASFINLQYEVSRLQILLTKQLGITTMKNQMNPENKIEDFLDTFDYRIKSNQLPLDSIINISQDQNNNNNLHEEQENAEIEQVESIIGLFYLKKNLNLDEKQQKIQKDIDLPIIPKECLKQEDLSGLNSARRV